MEIIKVKAQVNDSQIKEIEDKILKSMIMYMMFLKQQRERELMQFKI